MWDQSKNSDFFAQVKKFKGTPGLLKKPMNTKAELLLLKLIHLSVREVLLVKKVEIVETKTT